MSTNPILQERHLVAPSTVTSPDAPIETNGRFAIEGVITKSLFLVALLIVGAFAGWNTVEEPAEFEPAQMPGWILLAVIGGLALVVLSYRKPPLAKYLAPGYAIVQGVVVGAISHVYEIRFDGIVLQAVIATVAVFIAMMGLHLSRAFRITPRIRRGVMVATAGVMMMYLFQIVMRLIGTDYEVPFLHESSPIGIALSLAIVGLASFNLLVDFDIIERADQAGAPKPIEWSAALGLIVTLVWLYLELLRLLSKVRG